MKPTVAIVGLGLMGGSLGQALCRTQKYRVVGISRSKAVIHKAKIAHAIHSGSTDLRHVSVADIVVVAVPVLRIAPLIRQFGPYLKPTAVVTDVGSVKSSVIRDVPKSFHFVGAHPAKSPYFVGAHPLAGSHQSGISAARPDLFKGSSCVIVLPAKGSIAPVVAMWKAVGAKPVLMTAAAHDKAVALISHLPHVLAHAMVHSVMGKSSLMPLLAGSFRDVTRVASSDARQWMEILNANAVEVRYAIDQFEDELALIKKKLGTHKLGQHLSRSQRFRLPLFNPK